MPERGARQLGFRAVLGLIAFVLLCFAVALVPSIARVEKLRVGESSIHIVVTSQLVRFATLTVGALGVAGYAFLGAGAPRPRQLHVYGLCLILSLVQNAMAIAPRNLELDGYTLAGWIGNVLAYGIWGIYKCVFYWVMTNKFTILGSAGGLCRGVEFWGRSMMAAIMTAALFAALTWALAAGLLLRGANAEDILAVAHPFAEGDLKLPAAAVTVTKVLMSIASLGLFAFLVTSAAFMWASHIAVKGVVSDLIARGTAEKMLGEVRRKLGEHFLGVVISLSTTLVVILANAVDATNLVGAQEEIEELVTAIVNLIDSAGDIAGIILLSGMGALLRREDAEAGDVNRQIRGLLRAAALMGRGDITFEGQVAVTPSQRCIASFPGKYLEEWKALTWHCERHEISSACVFLPLSDPQQRFGKHAQASGERGGCWCAHLCGEEKDWGCFWFDAWRANIERVVELGLELVVVFFPGQAEQGMVEWDDLCTEDLWNGHGLGGSQKGEVAYLRKHGINFVSVDLVTVQSWLTSRREVVGAG